MKLLDEAQTAAIKFIRSKPKCALSADPGTGKTRCSLLSYDRAVIVVPVSLVSNWKKEIAKWRPSKTANVVTSSLVLSKSTDYLIIPYSVLVKLDVEKLLSLYKNVILDEAHFIKNPSSIRSKVACALLRGADRAVALSGTFIPNRVAEIWPLINAMGFINIPFRHFALRYCNGKMMPWGFDYSGASNVDDLKALLDPYFFKIKKSEVLPDLAPKKFVISEIDIPLDPSEAALNFNTLKVTKKPKGILGLATALKNDAIRKVPYSAAYITNYLNNNFGKKILVFGIHSEGLEKLSEALSIFLPGIVYGKSKKDRLAIVDAFKENPRSRVLLGHISVLGLGFNINEADHVFFHESDWIFGNVIQAADRAHRIGQEKEITVTFFCVKNSFDSYVIKKMLSKQKIIKGIL